MNPVIGIEIFIFGHRVPSAQQRRFGVTLDAVPRWGSRCFDKFGPARGLFVGQSNAVVDPERLGDFFAPVGSNIAPVSTTDQAIEKWAISEGMIGPAGPGDPFRRCSFQRALDRCSVPQ